MLKFFLIILLFCVRIIAAADQLPISVWPNGNCKIHDDRFSDPKRQIPVKCENGKFMAWSVRMNRDIPVSFLEMKTRDEFICRDLCWNQSETCLSIRENIKTFCFTGNSPALKKDEGQPTDVLQLACCDKTPPEAVPEKFIPLKTNKKYSHCIPSLLRNNCSHFYVWFQTNQIPYIGRDIIHQSVKDLTQCFELCKRNAFCTTIFFNSDEKICKMKYSQGYAAKSNESILLASADDLAVELYCCKYDNMTNTSTPVTDNTTPDTDDILPENTTPDTDKKPTVDCEFISTWFFVVMFASYFILLAVYVVYIFLRIKLKQIEEEKSISELDKVNPKKKKKRQKNIPSFKIKTTFFE